MRVRPGSIALDKALIDPTSQAFSARREGVCCVDSLLPISIPNVASISGSVSATGCRNNESYSHGASSPRPGRERGWGVRVECFRLWFKALDISDTFPPHSNSLPKGRGDNSANCHIYSKDKNQTHNKILNNNSGAAYIVALVTLLVGMILGLAMLRASNASFLSEDSRTKKMQAVDLSEAGIDYAFWQIHDQNKMLPYSADVTLSTGSFHVDATDDGSRDRSTMLITSTGTCGRHSYTTKRVSLGLLPYRYGRCENSEINDGNTMVTSGASGGLRTNGRIVLSSYFNNVTTGAWATTTISNNATVSPAYPNSPPIAFPDVDYAHYSSIATRTYSGSVSFLTNSLLGKSGVIYVDGDANIYGGYYSGVFIIVAKNHINIKGSLLRLNTNSFIALVTQNDINIDYGVNTVEAILYSHRSDNGGDIKIHYDTSIVGSMASDDITTDYRVTMSLNPYINLNIMRQLNLPGL